MINLDFYKGKRIGVLGLGKSGISTIQSLINSNIDYISFDDNEKTRQTAKSLIPDINLVEASDISWEQIDILVLSPGINIQNHFLNRVIIENNIDLLCDIELLYNQRQKEATFIGITGTNGKSTTTSLTEHILKSCNLKAEVGGNIGFPVLTLSPETTHYVLEMSSYQLELINNLRFKSACLLNITPDHLERHLTMEHYTKSKMNIFNHNNSESFAFINLDNHLTKKEYIKIKSNYNGRVIGISTETVGQDILTLKDNILYDNVFEQTQFNLKVRKYIPGKHNDENIIAAYGLARSLNLNSEEIIKAIFDFKGLEHRMEFVEEVNRVQIINDSKGTNSDATEKALLSYDNIYWIAGGLPKSNGINDLLYIFHKVKKAYLVGTAKHAFSEFMTQHHLPNIICKDLEDATKQAFQDSIMDTQPNVILLSPACASWDEWPNFEVRGDNFKKYIRELIKDFNK